jgi:hypothetical protein
LNRIERNEMKFLLLLWKFQGMIWVWIKSYSVLIQSLSVLDHMPQKQSLSWGLWSSEQSFAWGFPGEM